MKDYHTFIFDLDGTITNTMPVWFDIFRDGLQQFGISHLDDQTLLQYTHNFNSLSALGLSAQDITQFARIAHKLANERLAQSSLHTGAHELLHSLKTRGKRLGIYSAMDREIMEPAMVSHNLYAVVEVAVSGADVPRRKPHPDGILKVLQDLAIPEKEYDHAVYLGDKDTDLQAAANAGVDSILFYPTVHQEMYDLDDLKKYQPAHIVTDWRDLLP